MALTFNGASFDKPLPQSYTVGEKMTLTVYYFSSDYTGTLNGPGVGQQQQAQVTVSDSVGSAVFSESIPAAANGDEFLFNVTNPNPPVTDPITATASDTGNRTWTLVSNTNEGIDPTTGVAEMVAVFTATA